MKQDGRMQVLVCREIMWFLMGGNMCTVDMTKGQICARKGKQDALW